MDIFQGDIYLPQNYPKNFFYIPQCNMLMKITNQQTVMKELSIISLKKKNNFIAFIILDLNSMILFTFLFLKLLPLIFKNYNIKIVSIFPKNPHQIFLLMSLSLYISELLNLQLFFFFSL